MTYSSTFHSEAQTNRLPVKPIPSLVQLACSPTHGSRQRRCTCRQNSRMPLSTPRTLPTAHFRG